MNQKIVVAVIIIDKNNNVLLQDRKAISKYWEEWSFFWWHMENSETIMQTAQREASEELHISLWEDQIHYIGTTIHYLYDRNIKYIRHICLIPVEDVTDLNLKDYEWSGTSTFPMSEIGNLKFNTDMSQEKNLIEYHVINYSRDYHFSKDIPLW